VIELAQQGYEVAIAEPIAHFSIRRDPFPHDLRFLRFARGWLRPDDIVYCGHTLLYWLPLLHRLRLFRCHLVTLTYAREELDFAGAHRAILALTPAAAEEARRIAPKARVAHVGWGVNLSFFPVLEYLPSWFLSCGRTHRDPTTLCAAAGMSNVPLRVIAPSVPAGLTWPPGVTLTTGGKLDDTVPYRELLHDYYSRATASVIALQADPQEKTAVGFTNLIEAMAMSRPVIVTRTGALAGELDVERAGCGLHVPPNDPHALAAALQSLAADVPLARAMGEAGRRLCESHYNIQRFAGDLHRVFGGL
jgi:glycosyltransferase involved in cell wall biosynthesis